MDAGGKSNEENLSTTVRIEMILRTEKLNIMTIFNNFSDKCRLSDRIIITIFFI